MSDEQAPRSWLVRRVGKLHTTLAFRIYLLGLLQFFVVAVGLVVVVREGRRAGPSLETLRVVAESIAATPDDRAAIAVTLANAEKLLHTQLAVFDDRHGLVAGTRHGEPPPPPGPPPEGPSPPEFDGVAPPPGPPPRDPRSEGPPLPFPFIGPDRHLHVPIVLRDGRVWHLVVTAPHPEPPFVRDVGTTVVLVLFVVGISAWLTARSLAKPLAQISTATNAFGAGNLDARAGLTRRDELGEVAAAFDQMADRVTAALRAEKELLANISHELRTPLQRIHIAVDLAAEGDATVARESLVDIAEDLAELERIVEDVLSAARLSLVGGGSGKGASGLPPVRLASVDLHALLAKSEARFRSLHPERPLRNEVRGALPVVEVDATLMHRAVDNLLDNAHKYTDGESKPVTLAAWRDEATVVIEVRDQGIGVEAADLPRLFDPFFRADRSRTRGTGGLGLGLPLAKRIVLAHGGQLVIESVVGSGTVARITLPVGAAESTGRT